MYGIIYTATCIANGKVYVGQTTRILEKRLKEHFKLARSSTAKYKSYFCKALSKYGKDSFVWEVIDKADSRKELNK